MAKNIKIVEVGPRDGLQNEKVELTPAQRAEFVSRLARAGLKFIEAGAFVSPKWVPQMKNSDKVYSKLKTQPELKGVRLSFLVPNLHGMESALQAKVEEVAIFGSVSESFSLSNINATRKDSLQRFEEVVGLAKRSGIPVRGYLSTVFGCPFEGSVKVSNVIKMCEAFLKLGVYELSLGDTIGVATPKDVSVVLKSLNGIVSQRKLAMHFHDTRGTGLANVLRSLDLGITSFDSSIGGLGGCPYAPAASGNIATEDLAYMLHGMGLKTGLDIPSLLVASQWISKKIGKPLPSRVSLAGLPRISPRSFH